MSLLKYKHVGTLMLDDAIAKILACWGINAKACDAITEILACWCINAIAYEAIVKILACW